MRTDTPTLDAPGRAPGAATDDELRELDSGLDALQAVDSTRRTGLAGWDWSRVLLPVAAVVLLVAIWQAFAWLAGARGEPITGPGDVVGAFGTLWAQGLVQQAVATSVGRAVVGFALA
ncbi:ABC transporter permease, partial [Thiopseudomonas sp. 4R-3cl]